MISSSPLRRESCRKLFACSAISGARNREGKFRARGCIPGRINTGSFIISCEFVVFGYNQEASRDCQLVPRRITARKKTVDRRAVKKLIPSARRKETRLPHGRRRTYFRIPKAAADREFPTRTGFNLLILTRFARARHCALSRSFLIPSQSDGQKGARKSCRSARGKPSHPVGVRVCACASACFRPKYPAAPSFSHSGAFWSQPWATSGLINFSSLVPVIQCRF